MDCMEQRKAKTRKERENGAEKGAPWEFSWQTGRSKEFFFFFLIGGGESVEIFFINLQFKKLYVLRSRKWKPTPVFLPRKFHGTWRAIQFMGHKESDVTKKL